MERCLDSIIMQREAVRGQCYTYDDELNSPGVYAARRC